MIFNKFYIILLYLFLYNNNFVLCITPNYHGCLSATSKLYQYCNESLSISQRVEHLINLLTLDEKISLISPDPNTNTCPVLVKSIDRIGLPNYMWLTETNTGVSARCLSETTCATTFIGPMGLGASFNRSLWYAKGDVISTELRAFNNNNGYRNSGLQYKIGLDGFGPNMNMQRDPRFGRSSELPGEDPYLTGQYASQYVQGIQQIDNNGYIKMIAYLKHYDAYSLETNRGHDNHNISKYDFFDTYLPAYKTAFIEGKASGAMCSYSAQNGNPSCANGWLLNEVVRNEWNRPDIVITTDCGAVTNLLGPPVNASSGIEAATYVINNGTDIEAGSSIFSQFLPIAVKEKLVNETSINNSVRRAMTQLFQAGRFDSPNKVSWTNISKNAINSSLHQQVNFESALQSFVLLKNDDILPLKAGNNIAIVGPQSNATYGLLSDYYGDEPCYGGSNDFSCIISIYDGINEYNINGSTKFELGVDMNSTRTNGIQAALNLARSSDIIILALGIDKTIEYEGHDRPNILLPGLQESFGIKVLSLAKSMNIPCILILTNGGQLAIDDLIEDSTAIIEAFNPSVIGAKALGATIFGHENRFGKLPYTMYPKGYTEQLDLTNFDMSLPPGRSYKYYTGKPSFPFGYGLSMTSFSFNMIADNNSFTKYYGTFINTGNLDGDNVLMVYHRVGDDIRKKITIHPFPIKKLIYFERYRITRDNTLKFEVNLDENIFESVNEDGNNVVYNGTHYLEFTDGISSPIEFQILIN